MRKVILFIVFFIVIVSLHAQRRVPDLPKAAASDKVIIPINDGENFSIAIFKYEQRLTFLSRSLGYTEVVAKQDANLWNRLCILWHNLAFLYKVMSIPGCKSFSKYLQREIIPISYVNHGDHLSQLEKDPYHACEQIEQHLKVLEKIFTKGQFEKILRKILLSTMKNDLERQEVYIFLGILISRLDEEEQAAIVKLIDSLNLATLEKTQLKKDLFTNTNFSGWPTKESPIKISFPAINNTIFRSDLLSLAIITEFYAPVEVSVLARNELSFIHKYILNDFESGANIYAKIYENLSKASAIQKNWVIFSLPILCEKEGIYEWMYRENNWQNIGLSLKPIFTQASNILLSYCQYDMVITRSPIQSWFDLSLSNNVVGIHPAFITSLQTNTLFQKIMLQKELSVGLYNYLSWLSSLIRNENISDILLCFVLKRSWEFSKEFPDWATINNFELIQHLIQINVFSDQWKLFVNSQENQKNLESQRLDFIQRALHQILLEQNQRKNIEAPIALQRLCNIELPLRNNLSVTTEFKKQFCQILLDFSCHYLLENTFDIFLFSDIQVKSLLETATFCGLQTEKDLQAQKLISCLGLRLGLFNLADYHEKIMVLTSESERARLYNLRFAVQHFAWKAIADKSLENKDSKEHSQARKAMSLLLEGSEYYKMGWLNSDDINQFAYEYRENLIEQWRNLHTSETFSPVFVEYMLILLAMGSKESDLTSIFFDDDFISDLDSSLSDWLNKVPENRRIEMYEAIARFLVAHVYWNGYSKSPQLILDALAKYQPETYTSRYAQLRLEMAMAYIFKHGISLHKNIKDIQSDPILQNFLSHPYFSSKRPDYITLAVFYLRGIIYLGQNDDFSANLARLRTEAISDQRTQYLHDLFLSLWASRLADKEFLSVSQLDIRKKNAIQKRYSTAQELAQELQRVLSSDIQKNKLWGIFGKNEIAYNNHWNYNFYHYLQMVLQKTEQKKKYLESNLNYYGIDPNIFPTIPWDTLQTATKNEIDFYEKIESKIETAKEKSYDERKKVYENMLADSFEGKYNQQVLSQTMYHWQAAVFEEQASDCELKILNLENNVLSELEKSTKIFQESLLYQLEIAQKRLEIAKIEKERSKLRVQEADLGIKIADIDMQLVEYEKEFWSYQIAKDNIDNLISQIKSSQASQDQKRSLRIVSQIKAVIAQKNLDLKSMQREIAIRKQAIQILATLFDNLVNELKKEIENTQKSQEGFQDEKAKMLVDSLSIVAWKLSKQLLMSPWLSQEMDKIFQEQILLQKEQVEISNAYIILASCSQKEILDSYEKFGEIVEIPSLKNSFFTNLDEKKLVSKFPSEIDFRHIYIQSRNQLELDTDAFSSMLLSSLRKIVPDIILTELPVNMQRKIKREELLNFIRKEFLPFIMIEYPKLKNLMTSEAAYKAILFSMSEQYQLVFDKEIGKLALKYRTVWNNSVKEELAQHLQKLTGNKELQELAIKTLENSVNMDNVTRIFSCTMESLSNRFRCRISQLMASENIEELKRKAEEVKTKLAHDKKEIEMQQNEEIQNLEESINKNSQILADLENKLVESQEDYDKVTSALAISFEELKKVYLDEKMSNLRLSIADIDGTKKKFIKQQKELYYKNQTLDSSISEEKIEIAKVEVQICETRLKEAEASLKVLLARKDVIKEKKAQAQLRKAKSRELKKAATTQVEIQQAKIDYENTRKLFADVCQKVGFKPVINFVELEEIKEESKSRILYYIRAMERWQELTTGIKMNLKIEDVSSEKLKEAWYKLVFTHLVNQYKVQGNRLEIQSYQENEQTNYLIKSLRETGKCTFAIGNFNQENFYFKIGSNEQSPAIRTVVVAFVFKNSPPSSPKINLILQPSNNKVFYEIKDSLPVVKLLQKEKSILEILEVFSKSLPGIHIKVDSSKWDELLPIFILRNPIGTWSLEIAEEDRNNCKENLIGVYIGIFYSYFKK